MRTIILLLASFSICLAGEVKEDSLSLYRTKEFKAMLRHYSLGDKIIFYGSETVYLDTVKLERDVDYDIDYVNARLYMLLPVNPDARLRVTYKILPWEQSKYLSIYRQIKADTLKTKTYALTDTSVDEGATARINVSGNKTLGIKLSEEGNWEMTQTLDAAIEGNLGDETEVSGYLQDNELPYTNEGTTASIAEIDKIFFQIKYRDYLARLGDLELDIDNSRLTAYSGKLKGIEGKKEELVYPVKADVVYALAQGVFMRADFMGTEGVQGAYKLYGKYNEDNIFLISGSVKIWVDDVQRENGKDFTIDYNRSEITFNPIVPIHSTTRIYAEYSYSLNQFRRIFEGGSTDVPIDKERRNHLGISLLKEADDPYSRYGSELTEEELDYFRKHYEKGKPVYLPSGHYEGKDKGDYVKINTGNDLFYYKYAGYHKGDWSVTFTQVEDKQGDYKYSQSISAYEYVGQNNGDYIAMIPYEPPQKREMVGLRADLNPLSFMQFNGEGAISSYQENILYEGNSRNWSGAFDTGLLLGQEKDYNLFMGFHKRMPEFNPFIPKEKGEFFSDWLLAPSDSLSSYTEGDARCYLPFYKAYYIEANGGLIKAHGISNEEGADWDGYRYSTGAGGEPVKGLTIKAETGIKRQDQYIDNETDMLYRKDIGLDLMYKHGLLAPEASGNLLWGKDYTDSTRVNLPYREQVADAAFMLSNENKWQAGPFTEVSKRELCFDDGYNISKRGWNAGFKAEGTGNSSLQPRFYYIHSVNKYFRDTGETGYTDLAEAYISYLSSARALQFDISYSLSTKLTSLREARYEETEDGMGQFSRDPNTGEFYPDQEGNYRRYFVDVGQKEKRGEVNLISHVTLMPPISEKEAYPNRLWKIELSTDILEEEVDASFGRLASLYIPDFQGVNCRNGLQDGMSRLTLFPDNNDIQPSLEFKAEKSLDGNEEGYLKIYKAWSISPALTINRYKPYHFDIQGIYRKSREELTGEYLFRIIEQGITPKIAYDIKKDLTPFVSLELKRKQELERDILLNSVTPTTGLDWGFIKAGTMHAEVGFINRTSNTKDIPVQLFTDEEIGLTKQWLLRVDYRLSQNMIGSLNYMGIKKPDIQVRHGGEMLVRLVF